MRSWHLTSLPPSTEKEHLLAPWPAAKHYAEGASPHQDVPPNASVEPLPPGEA